MNTRRKFLFGCSTAALGVACLPSNMVLAGPTGAGLEGLSLAAFERHLHTLFTVHANTGPALQLRLAAAEAKPSQAARAGQAPDAHHEKFSLRFRGPAEPRLPQDTYTFVQGAQKLPLFIVPIHPAARDYCDYEAVINRPVEGPPIAAGPGLYPTLLTGNHQLVKG